MDIIAKANGLIESGKYEKAYELLLPLLDKRDPEALFLFSTFQVDTSESIQEFEIRSLNLIKEAADLELPEALYTLGVIYETGDGVTSDMNKASSLFKKAAERGHSRAKLSYGLDLVYGSNGISQDKILGLTFIKESVSEGVEGAEELLDSISDE